MATEDFSTYDLTEVDTADLTATADRVTVVEVAKADVVHLSDSKGVAHFSGDFEHLFDAFPNSSADISSEGHPWAMANTQDASGPIDTANGSMFMVQIFMTSGANCLFSPIEIDGGSFNNPTALSVVKNSVHFCTIERDESVGDHGQLELRIYDDAARDIGDLVDSVTQALNTSKKNFQYVYGFQGKGDGSGSEEFDGYTDSLDLQEVAAVPHPQLSRRQGRQSVARASYF